MPRARSVFVLLFFLSLVSTKKISDFLAEPEKLGIIIECLCTFFDRKDIDGDPIHEFFKKSVGKKITFDINQKEKLTLESAVKEDWLGLKVGDERIDLTRHDFSRMYKGFPIYKVYFSDKRQSFKPPQALKILSIIENEGPIELNLEADPELSSAAFFKNSNQLKSYSVTNSKDDENYRFSMLEATPLEYEFYLSEVSQAGEFFNQGFGFREAQYLMNLPPLLSQAPPSGPYQPFHFFEDKLLIYAYSLAMEKLIEPDVSVPMEAIFTEHVATIKFTRSKFANLFKPEDFVEFLRKVAEVELRRDNHYECRRTGYRFFTCRKPKPQII